MGRRMAGNDSSGLWRFFTRGPGLFYTWPFFPLFKYLPILFGSHPSSGPGRAVSRQPKPDHPSLAPKRGFLRRLLRVSRGAWRAMRPTKAPQPAKPQPVAPAPKPAPAMRNAPAIQPAEPKPQEWKRAEPVPVPRVEARVFIPTPEPDFPQPSPGPERSRRRTRSRSR